MNFRFLLIVILFASINIYMAHSANILLGVDVLIKNDFDLIKGKKVGLVTNHTGRTSFGHETFKVFKEQTIFELKGLLTPEHGYYTTIPAGKHVDDEKIDDIPVYSLYGKNRKPSKELLDKFDCIVFDIQDIGVRSYTYISTLFNCMEACAEHDKEFILLDRPNPMGGQIVDGNVVEEKFRSFVSKLPVSYIHGCTFGEIAKMINGEKWLAKGKHCDLKVVEMAGWTRDMRWEDTGLIWFPTSPHIPTVGSIRGAAMLGIIGELGVISIGIGTTSPFQYLGGPNFETEKFLLMMEDKVKNGVVLNKAKYQPFYGMNRNKMCNGIFLTFPKDSTAQYYRSSLSILHSLLEINPELVKTIKKKSKAQKMFNKVCGSDKLLKALLAGSSYPALMELAKEGLDEYKTIRQKYLLY